MEAILLGVDAAVRTTESETPTGWAAVGMATFFILVIAAILLYFRRGGR
ncbi:hypothetical protein [Modestobacter sp. SYSU DS0875]